MTARPVTEPAGTTAPSRRPAAFLPSRDRILPVATTVGVLLVAELVLRTQVLGSEFPPVTAVVSALVGEATSGELWGRLQETVVGWLLGFTMATVVALPLGLLLASTNFLFRSSRLVIEFLRPIPPLAILPLAVLLLGSGTSMKVWLVAFSAVWPMLFQTIYGAHDVDGVARDTARSYGLSRREIYRHVVVPGALPYIATGVRLSLTIALVVTIATELIVGSAGIGFRINEVRYAGDTTAMYALILVAGLLGWMSTAMSRAFEKRLLFWHPSQRQEVVD